MTPLIPTNIRIDQELLEALQVIRERDGVPVSEQVRRAILMWIESKGGSAKKAERKRADTRKRP
jgi:hypothetical protein